MKREIVGVKMATIKFTAARVDGFVCDMGKSQAFLWDEKTPGLGVRATLAGAKAYIFQAKIHGQTVRTTIGDTRSWAIDQAQGEARRLQRLIDEGKDPREVRATERASYEARKDQSRRQEATFGEAWESYIIARQPHWSPRHYLDHVNLAGEGGIQKKRGKGTTQPGPIAELRPEKLSEFTGERMTVWLESHAATRPTMAALAYRLVRAFIRWASEEPDYRGVIQSESYKARSVKSAVPKVNAKHGDCLQREQLPAWFREVRQIGNPVISAYLQALLITGARREEMAALKWTDLDFQWRSMSLSDKVEASGRIIPMTPYLTELLFRLPRRNDWVFSAASADGKIAEPRIAHNHALSDAGLPGLTLHGLRRSFGTLSEWCEVPVGIVAQIMGHKPSATAEKHYRRRPLDLLRRWHDQIEAWMLEQAGICLADS